MAIGARPPKRRHERLPPQGKPRLLTPPVPPDLPQWGPDGRFRANDSGDSADLIGSPLPDRRSFAASVSRRFYSEMYHSKGVDSLFDNDTQAARQRRKHIVKLAIDEITSRKPKMLTQDMIQTAGKASDTFLSMYRDIPIRFPLSDSDRVVLVDVVQRCIESAATESGVGRTSSSSGAKAIMPPGFSAADAKRFEQLRMATVTDEVMEGFREVKASHRNRIERMFATYEPSRMREVDRLLEKASAMGFAGAEEDLLQSLVLQYGPEPHDTQRVDAAVVISDPILNADASVTIFASIRGEKTDVPSWSLAMGNTISSSPIGLDGLAAMGVAQAEVVSSADLGDFDRTLTLCLSLKHGAVRQGVQYTVYLALLGSGGVKAKDSKTFFVDRDGSGAAAPPRR